jgi:circadian clock protein KaiC
VALEDAVNFPVHYHLTTLGIWHLSEWDALMFLHSHGATLSGAPQIAHLLGYSEAEFVTALDRLESLGLVRRPLGGKGLCLYRFSLPKDQARLSSFVELMRLSETRTGRLQLRSNLLQGRSEPPTPADDSDLPLKRSLIMDKNNDDVVRTGIAGLDGILLGGIPRKNLILVEGTVGSGKTILGMEFIYRGITQFNEPGMIVVFETSPDKLIRDAAAFGWDFAALQRESKLQIIFTSPEVLEQELSSPTSLLMETAVEIGAQRIFIDGIGLLRRASNGDSMTPSGPGSYRDVLHQLIEGLSREKMTAMFSHEIGSSTASQMTLESAELLVDTVVRLTQSLHGRRIECSIQIVKSRGQDYDRGKHALDITGGKGLEVYRRVQAPVRLSVGAAQPSSTTRRSAIGVEALDTLLGGGIFDGSTTMVVGLSGVGKTVLGTQILLEGATKQGTTGLLVSLDEHPAQIVRNAQTIGLALQEQVDSGVIHLLFESPQELNIDAHFAKIVSVIEKYNIQRMVIDGMTSYSTALVDQGVYRDFFHALVSHSKERLMTTFFNYENPEFLGLSTFMPDFPVSSIVDNIILLSLVEINSSLRRCATVVKARGSKHEFDSREYTIGQGGITLLPFEESVANGIKALPFANYSSILSRAPTRLTVSAPTKEAKVKATASRANMRRQ